jgi:hypothetical protein
MYIIIDDRLYFFKALDAIIFQNVRHNCVQKSIESFLKERKCAWYILFTAIST